MLHTVVFIGRSGCGKGTQAGLLKNRIVAHDIEKRKILYVESGDRFRKFIRGNSYSSRLSREIYEKDARQPDFLAGLMWGEMLIEELEEDMHLVFDGVARAEPEAKMLTTALGFYRREMPTVIYINVSRKWSEERLLSRGRQDDVNINKIDKRLDWFDKDVLSAIEYFKSDPFYRVIEVDGEQTIEEVHRDIIAKYDYGS
ncbi:nucleoside monophosphate kinase [Candidatus Parcubacteria bacterium]|nr:nucleoside monophosphate kinase [Candidatus Parcubacteria bacterium]